MNISFSILGEPQGKGRPRFVARHDPIANRSFGAAHTPEKTILYENLIRTEYIAQCGQKKFSDVDMLDVRIFAYYSIPKSVSKKKREAMLSHQIRPTKKPDFDNIGKVVCDSLNGIAYRDDAQIVDSQVRKFYADVPKVVVTIQNIGGA